VLLCRWRGAEEVRGKRALKAPVRSSSRVAGAGCLDMRQCPVRPRTVSPHRPRRTRAPCSAACKF